MTQDTEELQAECSIMVGCVVITLVKEAGGLFTGRIKYPQVEVVFDDPEGLLSIAELIVEDLGKYTKDYGVFTGQQLLERFTFSHAEHYRTIILPFDDTSEIVIVRWFKLTDTYICDLRPTVVSTDEDEPDTSYGIAMSSDLELALDTVLDHLGIEADTTSFIEQIINDVKVH